MFVLFVVSISLSPFADKRKKMNGLVLFDRKVNRGKSN